MLACRPMICFAAAAVTGILFSRYAPGYCAVLAPYGWLGFAVAVVWFVATPPRPAGSMTDMPASYQPLLLARPGWLASRGVNRFLIVLCLAVFLLAAERQSGWRRTLAASRLPDKKWLTAHFIAGAPSHEHPAAGGGWRVPALLIHANGGTVPPLPVRLSGPPGPTFRRGDRITARVRLGDRTPRSYPGAFDFNFWLERDGLAASAFIVRSRRAARENPLYRVEAVQAPGPVVRVMRVVDGVRATAIRKTLQYGGASGGTLAAMLYGYRKEVGEDLRDAFRRVGIGHVLAISGLHVGLVVGLLWWLGGWIGWNLQSRAVACLVLTIVYLGLSGGQVAATRATLMAAIHLGGLACGRKSDMLNSLGAAAFLICLVNPTAPLDVGFQLSFTAVVFIYMAVRSRPNAEKRRGIHAPVDASPWRRRLRRDTVSLVRLSAATWVGLFPIIAVVFNQVNLVGLPINILVIPLMSFVLAGGLLLPWLGWIPGASLILTLPERLLAATALWADRLPGSSFAVHAPAWQWVALFYLFVVLSLARGMVRAGPGRGRWTMATLVGLIAAGGGLLFSMASLPPPQGGRIAVLPGGGLGSIVAEADNGDLVLMGTLDRGGLNEAGWLHHLHRAGPVNIVHAGRPGDLTPLSYHHRIRSVLELPLTAADVVHGRAGWQPVPGAAGVDFSHGRDGKGRLLWLAARTGKQSVCLVSGIYLDRFCRLIRRLPPGFDVSLFSVRFAGPTASLPAGEMGGAFVAVRGMFRAVLPRRWFFRHRYGTLVVRDGLTGYDGREWVVPGAIDRTPAPAE